MTNCRACLSERLYMFMPLGQHPLANGFLRAEQLQRPEPRFPLEIHACLDCGLIQVADQIPAEFFRHYVYVPSASQQMQDHFAALAGQIEMEFLNGGSGLVVDIGCNDGLLLGHLQQRGQRTLGIDPALNITEIARRRGVPVVAEYFTPPLAARVRAEHGPAKVIVTTNTFHHIGNLDSFTEGVEVLLAEDGVFVIEVPHALQLVHLNQFDGVYHEHVSQLTVKSIVDHLARFGLTVIQVDALQVHGGSMRVFARRTSAGVSGSPDVQAWIDREIEQGLLQSGTYDAFRVRVEQIRDDLMTLLLELKAQGSRIAGYGASARGNTLLNYYGIGPDLLDYIVDRNDLKHGLFTPGMHIPVHGPEKLESDSPDYVLLLAWNFAEEISRQLEPYREGGGRLIVPIPEVRIGV